MLLSLFTWAENTGVGIAIRDSVWLFPAIEAIHLVALAVIGGAVLIVNMRYAGLGLTDAGVRELADNATPWFRWGLLVMLVTGALLLISEATKCYYNAAFWYKMLFLVAAIAFSAVTSRHLRVSGTPQLGPLSGRVVGTISVLLWSGVGVMGRGIGFY